MSCVCVGPPLTWTWSFLIGGSVVSITLLFQIQRITALAVTPRLRRPHQVSNCGDHFVVVLAVCCAIVLLEVDSPTKKDNSSFF